MPLRKRQQKRGITRNGRVGRNLHGREFAPERHHAVEHHQLAVVIEQGADGRINNRRSRGRPLLGGRVERENQIVAGKPQARVEEMSAHLRKLMLLALTAWRHHPLHAHVRHDIAVVLTIVHRVQDQRAELGAL